MRAVNYCTCALYVADVADMADVWAVKRSLEPEGQTDSEWKTDALDDGNAAIIWRAAILNTSFVKYDNVRLWSVRKKRKRLYRTKVALDFFIFLLLMFMFLFPVNSCVSIRKVGLKKKEIKKGKQCTWTHGINESATTPFSMASVPCHFLQLQLYYMHSKLSQFHPINKIQE